MRVMIKTWKLRSASFWLRREDMTIRKEPCCNIKWHGKYVENNGK